VFAAKRAVEARRIEAHLGCHTVDAGAFVAVAPEQLTPAEGKDLLAELQRLVLQTQMEEYVMCARVCRERLTLRRQRDCRTRTLSSCC
jgi:hypothetical protein